MGTHGLVYFHTKTNAIDRCHRITSTCAMTLNINIYVCAMRIPPTIRRDAIEKNEWNVYNHFNYNA